MIAEPMSDCKINVVYSNFPTMQLDAIIIENYANITIRLHMKVGYGFSPKHFVSPVLLWCPRNLNVILTRKRWRYRPAVCHNQNFNFGILGILNPFKKNDSLNSC